VPAAPASPPALSPEPPGQPAAAPASPPITQAEAILEVARRASNGNERCLAGLRQILDIRPDLWESVGNVSLLAERAWVELIAAGDKLVEEAALRRLRALKARLAGNDPTPLEEMLVDLIGVTYLAAEHGEFAAAAPAGGSIQQATLRYRRAESAQRRFASAVKTLTMVRALLPKGMSAVPAATPDRLT